jgi:hypothetical protein
MLSLHLMLRDRRQAVTPPAMHWLPRRVMQRVMQRRVEMHLLVQAYKASRVRRDRVMPQSRLPRLTHKPQPVVTPWTPRRPRRALQVVRMEMAPRIQPRVVMPQAVRLVPGLVMRQVMD